jgi:hypothetical protein
MRLFKRAVAPVNIKAQGTAEVHTPENPYCGELSCWCHTDVAYHDQVTSSLLAVEVDDTLFAFAMATLKCS